MVLSINGSFLLLRLCPILDMNTATLFLLLSFYDFLECYPWKWSLDFKQRDTLSCITLCNKSLKVSSNILHLSDDVSPFFIAEQNVGLRSWSIKFKKLFNRSSVPNMSCPLTMSFAKYSSTIDRALLKDEIFYNITDKIPVETTLEKLSYV